MKMVLNPLKCTKDVDETQCTHSESVKNGKTNYGQQRYKCRVCGRSILKQYLNNAYASEINIKITQFLKEGLGIRSASRLLRISKTTVTRRILLIASTIEKPKTSPHQTYELDELRTYVRKKTNLKWIAYAMRRDTKEVIDFNIGYRTNEMLRKVTHTLLNTHPVKIYTDKLINYKYLIPEYLHSTKLYGINHIERNNLTIRTHLKRLNRRTICYSTSMSVLSACMNIYFWG